MLHVLAHANDPYRDDRGLEQIRGDGTKVTIVTPNSPIKAEPGETLVAFVWVDQPIDSITARATPENCRKYGLRVPEWCAWLLRERVVFIQRPNTRELDKQTAKKALIDARRACVNAAKQWKFA